MATIEEVAARAKVGIGTVSRVLNDSPQVRPATRAKVLAAMHALDYHPARAGKKSSRRSHQSIAVLVPFFDQPAAYQRLRGIVGELHPHGFEIVLMNVEAKAQARSHLMELPRRRDIDGLLIISLPLSVEDGDRLATAAFPTVLVDTQHPALPSIVIDDYSGGRMATNHLLDLGHRRIAFIGEPHENPFGFYSSGHREDGYREAMAAAGVEVSPAYLRFGPHERGAARSMAIDLLAMADPPTAIVAASDVQALGVLEAASATGRSVPDDFSLIGYDDIDFSSYVGLTTIRQPLFTSGVRGAQVLVSALTNEGSRPFTEQLTIELIARSTTAPMVPGLNINASNAAGERPLTN